MGQIPIDIGKFNPEAYYSNFHKWCFVPKTAASVVDAAPVDGNDAADATELALIIAQDPPFVAQGDSIELRFTVTNNGELDATNVSLRDQLPEGLTYISADVDAGGTAECSRRFDHVDGLCGRGRDGRDDWL